MKNTICIDIDTTREKQLLVSKGSESEVPTNEEDAKKMIIMDIACLCEGLCELIHVASQNGYGSKEGLVNASIEQLKNLLVDGSVDNESLNDVGDDRDSNN